jgi:hypothetical protein
VDLIFKHSSSSGDLGVTPRGGESSGVDSSRRDLGLDLLASFLEWAMGARLELEPPVS